MRKKGLAGILSLLICIAIVGVGFASWVISGNATDEATGTVVVEQVVDNRISLTVTPTDQNIRLAGKETAEQNISGAWLNIDGAQDLTLELEYTVAFKDGRDGYNGISVTATKTLDPAIQTLVENGYITVSDPVTTTTPNAEGKGTITVTFSWGEKFENKNPYTYYNGLANTDENANSAKTALTDLYAAQSKQITIKVTASYSAA